MLVSLSSFKTNLPEFLFRLQVHLVTWPRKVLLSFTLRNITKLTIVKAAAVLILMNYIVLCVYRLPSTAKAVHRFESFRNC